jgi:hypothetical protein
MAILKSANVARTIEWYRRAGFEVLGVFPESGEPTWCEATRDGVVLQFFSGDTPGPEPPLFTGTLYFRHRASTPSTTRSRTTQRRRGDLKHETGATRSWVSKTRTPAS